MDAVLLGKMLDAGFTKDEILSLVGDPAVKDASGTKAEKGPEPAAVEPAAAAEQEPAKEPEKDHAKDPEPAKEPAADSALNDRLTGIEKSIAGLVKTIQAANVKNDSFGGTANTVEEETDRIMKSIIRPEHEKKG